MRRKGQINWLAVLAGHILDIMLTLIIGLAALQINPSLAQGRLLDSTSGVVVMVLSSLTTVLGGWLAGLIARDERFLHGFLVGGAGIVLLLIQGWTGTPPTLESIVFQIAATFLAGLAGAASRWTPIRQRRGK